MGHSRAEVNRFMSPFSIGYERVGWVQVCQLLDVQSFNKSRCLRLDLGQETGRPLTMRRLTDCPSQVPEEKNRTLMNNSMFRVLQPLPKCNLITQVCCTPQAMAVLDPFDRCFRVIKFGGSPPDLATKTTGLGRSW